MTIGVVMKKKINPRRVPAPVTMKDVDKIRTDAVKEAVRASMAIFFTVLFDKQGFDRERLGETWQQIESLSECVNGAEKFGVGKTDPRLKREVTIEDLKRTLAEEYDIHLE